MVSVENVVKTLRVSRFNLLKTTLYYKHVSGIGTFISVAVFHDELPFL